VPLGLHWLGGRNTVRRPKVNSATSQLTARTGRWHAAQRPPAPMHTTAMAIEYGNAAKPCEARSSAPRK